MKQNFLIKKLISAIGITGLLIYFMLNTTSPKVIFLPFLVCSISMIGKQMALFLNKNTLVNVFQKLFLVGFLLFLFGFLIMAGYISLRDESYSLLIGSMPFWIIGLFMIKNKLLPKKAKEEETATVHLVQVISAGLVILTVLAGIGIAILGIKREDTVLIFMGGFFVFGALTFILGGLFLHGTFNKFKIDVFGLYVGIFFVIFGGGFAIIIPVTIVKIIPVLMFVAGVIQIVKSIYLERNILNMKDLMKNWKGILLCFLLAIPSWFLGKCFEIVGGAVIAIITGMVIGLFWKKKGAFQEGIKFTSKKILQWAVILLGFGLNLGVVFQTGLQSFPIIVCTIATSLIIAFALHKVLHIPKNISTLIGCGSSICGGSAVAATASVIDANDDEVAQAISVIFFFNVLAAVLFPVIGSVLGFSTISGEAFGIFSGTAINDTSSVTAAAATWDSMWGLGTETLDKAVTVKLTRTLAIIPITLVLAFIRTRESGKEGKKVDLKRIFPFFILYFIGASLVTTVAIGMGVPSSFFVPFKQLSKFFIVMAMTAIGLNTDIVKLVRTGVKPIVMGASCWTGITIVSLILQRLLGIW